MLGERLEEFAGGDAVRIDEGHGFCQGHGRVIGGPQKKTEQQVAKGDVVEFSTGPFKGYKAKVLKIDDTKSEMTVELLDVVVPIPITTKMNTARVIQKAAREESS